MTRKSEVFRIAQHWLGLDNHHIWRLMPLIEELAAENHIDLEDASRNQIRNLADAAFRIMEEEAWQ